MSSNISTPQPSKSINLIIKKCDRDRGEWFIFLIFKSSTTIDIEKCRRDLKKSLLIFKNTSNIFKKLPKKAEKLSRPIVKNRRDRWK